MQRKLLYNQVQELKGNIRVFARVRSDDRAVCQMQFPDDTTMLVNNLDSTKKPISYEFEHVYSNTSKQEDVFKVGGCTWIQETCWFGCHAAALACSVA